MATIPKFVMDQQRANFEDGMRKVRATLHDAANKPGATSDDIWNAAAAEIIVEGMRFNQSLLEKFFKDERVDIEAAAGALTSAIATIVVDFTKLAAKKADSEEAGRVAAVTDILTRALEGSVSSITGKGEMAAKMRSVVIEGKGTVN